MSRIRLSTPLPPKLTDWLKDVYPAWLQLPEGAFHALVPFNAPQAPLSLNYFETAADIAASSIFSNLRLFLTLISEGRIEITEAGCRLRANMICASMVRTVFEAAFAVVNPRTLTKLAHPWVQEQAGIIFWGISITADTPRAVSELMRYCFVPPEKFLDQPFSVVDVYMRAVYLTPLTWFGLMTTTSPLGDQTAIHDRLYQKTSLFDRLIHFDIERAQPAERPH